MSQLLVLLAAAIVNALIAECFGWFPWIAEQLIQCAVKRLPRKVRERYQEEWLAELEVLPGREISALVFAIRILMRASKVRQEIVGGRGIAFKHAFDRVFALALLVLLAPVLSCAALAVRLTSPGPVLFRQRRVGRNGEVFDLYKFRSMRIEPPGPGLHGDDASAIDLVLGDDTGVEDPYRRTSIGRFLRRTSLDELPQLFNVLRGEMSFIGPRPERPEFVELFEHHVCGYGDRHHVKSGITGWAQIHGLRSQTSLAERVEWDNYYMAHWSLGLDLKILVLTLVSLFRRAN
jgi:lipopolysaccharide/colanic/teichoic acid biosynthesis glycosyltransferase